MISPLATIGSVATISPATIIFLSILKVIFASVLGIAVFAVALWLMVKMFKISPLSVRKEIEENRNTALGIVCGSIFIAFAIIIGAALG